MMSLRKDLFVGSAVHGLKDGSYIFEDKEYIVQGQKITEIWSLTDENQLSFDVAWGVYIEKQIETNGFRVSISQKNTNQ